MEKDLFDLNSEDLECNSDREADVDSCSKSADFFVDLNAPELYSGEDTHEEDNGPNGPKPLSFIQTTEEKICEMVRCWDQHDNIYFCRVSVSPHKKIKQENNRLWGSLKQKKQYGWMNSKFANYSDIDDSILQIHGIYEQFKTGNLHIHLLVKLKEGKLIHDFKADLSSMFEITKKDELNSFFHSQEITDIEGVLNYLFKKKEKAYENVDKLVFRPFRIG